LEIVLTCEFGRERSKRRVEKRGPSLTRVPGTCGPSGPPKGKGGGRYTLKSPRWNRGKRSGPRKITKELHVTCQKGLGGGSNGTDREDQEN